MILLRMRGGHMKFERISEVNSEGGREADTSSKLTGGKMNKKNGWRKCHVFVLVFAFHLFVSFRLTARQELSVADIVEKNIQAVGGKERLAQIKNFSFRLETRTYFVTSDGTMKTILEYQPPVSIEAIAVNQDQVKRNFVNQISEVTGFEKSRLQCIAKLYSGLFTLANFSRQLTLQGVKTYGPEKYYCLTTSVDDLQVSFFVDAEEFFIKRLVFSEFDSESGKHENVYEYGNYKETNGIRFPTMFFLSQVGTAGTAGSRISESFDVKINSVLERDFFSKLEINAGEVKIAAGAAKGNILYCFSEGRSAILVTNFTPHLLAKTGFESNDHLRLFYNDNQDEIVFYSTSGEARKTNAFTAGAKLMTVDMERGSLYFIFFGFSSNEEVNQMLKSLSPLSPIELKKIK